MVEAEDERIAQATGDLGERHGFRLGHRTAELTGVCGACRTDDPGQPGAEVVRWS